MKRFEAIAVLLSQTPQDAPILRRALELTKNNKASLSVYSVLDEPALVAEMHVSRSSRREILKQVKLIRRENLKTTIELLREGWLAVRGKLLVGKPFIRVIQEVLKNEHDLLMLPAEKQKNRSGLFLGGLAMHLLRKCPCVVWVFRPRSKRNFRRIMAAVNVATRQREEIEMNVKILEIASSLARQERAELHIVHCWKALAQSALAMAGGAVEERRHYQREAKANRLKLLQTYLDRLEIDETTSHIHMLRGEATICIPELAKEKSVDLIVMGTVARSGIPGFFMGNTAEKILNSVPCSVLAVKPSGFVSPVPFAAHRGSTT